MIENEIKERIEKALSPTEIRIVNQSHLHAGHPGDDGSGESHFKLVITSNKFVGESRIARERMVHKALGGVMGKIHALSLTLSSPK